MNTNRILVPIACGLAAWLTVGAPFARAAGPERLRISVIKKTADQRSGPTQQLHKTTGRGTEKDVFYKLEFQRLMPDVPENLTVEWLVAIESMGGRIRPAAKGSEEIVLPPGRSATLETSDIKLSGIEWNGGGRRDSGSIKEDLYGYAVRVRDDKGKLVGEKYSPKDMEQRVVDLEEELEKKDRFEKGIQKFLDRKGPPPPVR